MPKPPKPSDWARSISPPTVFEIQKARVEEARERMITRRAGQEVAPPSRLPFRRKPKAVGQTWLVIGDSHAHPDHPNHRYEWLGRMAADLKPDLMWDCGDWWDMPSLSGYDKRGSRAFEGARYWLDVEAGIDAQERMLHQMKGWRPKRMIRTLGNHEDRITRFLQEEPRFDGIVGLSDLESERFGWRPTRSSNP